MFTDIEGSTRLLARAGDGYADLLAAHHCLLREVFDAHSGYEVDTAGHAFFVAFASAKHAVVAAAEAQQALAAHDWPEGERIWVRIGIHTGERQLIDGNYVGLDVHAFAGLCSTEALDWRRSTRRQQWAGPGTWPMVLPDGPGCRLCWACA